MNCVCFVAHKYDSFVRDQWLKLLSDLEKSETDVFLLFDMTDKDPTASDLTSFFKDLADRTIPEERCIMFYEDEVRDHLIARGYDIQYYEGISKLFYGNIMLKYMDFWHQHRKHRHYDYYWFIEWDVFYDGNWRDLISKWDNIDADYVSRSSTCGNEYKDNWCHHDQWKTTTLKPFEKSELFVTFNPIMRLSDRAMSFLDHVYSEGNSGFYEVFLGSVLKREGFTLDGFYEHDDLDVLSFTWLPHGKSFNRDTMNRDKHLLYHPMKSNPYEHQ